MSVCSCHGCQTSVISALPVAVLRLKQQSAEFQATAANFCLQSGLAGRVRGEENVEMPCQNSFALTIACTALRPSVMSLM